MLRILVFLVFGFCVQIGFAHSDQQTLIEGSLTGTALEKALTDFKSDLKKSGMSKEKLYYTYKKHVDNIGVLRISEILEKNDPACHGISHTLGVVIGERVNDLKTGMKICSSTCTYGCLHGVFKNYFSKLGKEYHRHDAKSSHKENKHHKRKVVFTQQELQRFSKDVNQACSKSDSIVSDFHKGNCAHGIGHAMAQLAGDVKLANIYCGVFPQTDMQYYCETGVFMELAHSIKSQIFTRRLKRSEETKIAVNYCEKQSLYPSACLRFLLPKLKSLGQITRFATICSNSMKKTRSQCYNAMGYHARDYIASKPTEINYLCVIGNSDDRSACISGLSLMKKGQRHRNAIAKACLLLDNDDLSRTCEDQVSRYYYDIENPSFASLVDPSN